MTTPFSLTNNNQPNCDGWRDKLVGKFLLSDDEESAFEAGKYIRRKDLPSPNRVLSPNSIVTMDFRPDRLNVRVDRTMKVTGVNYG